MTNNIVPGCLRRIARYHNVFNVRKQAIHADLVRSVAREVPHDLRNEWSRGERRHDRHRELQNEENFQHVRAF